MITEELLSIRDLGIFTKRMGSGTPIVFLHGGPGGEHRYFLPHLEGLADTFELIFYDQRGCGQSQEDTNQKYSFDEEVETLEDLRKSMGLEKLNLVGESWGSMLALLYASRYPQHVNKLFLTAAVGATAEGYLKFGELLEGRLSTDDKKSLDQLMVKYRNGQIEVSEIFKVIDPYYLFSPEHLVNKTKTKSNAEVNRILGQEIIDKYSDSLNYEVLKDFPILIAQGDTDIITPKHLEELFLPYLPHTEVKVIKNCGHWTVIEQPQLLSSLIREYFM
ncbi:MAG TPA: alpha/beta hydrolase [Pseudoneobacillus sp.]|nr:alpha/beta hydrolase [Pseudoneobacillus sp.]